MDTDDLCYLGLVDVGRRIREGELSSAEVTEAVLRRIGQFDGTLHSYAMVTGDLARQAAARADARIRRGEYRGPLHGVPVAVKDLCRTKGIPTAAGMPMHADFVPDRDATVVARLESAGAVLVGKLQMTEGAFSAHHPSMAAPVNPWNPAQWPGVSSSGSGVATAAGLCYGAIGTDTLGSIRFPCTMNGVTGLKPTWGRVSRAGLFALAETMDHVGPMARSAADAAAILGAIAGPDPDDPTALQDAPDDYLAGLEDDLHGVRIGIDRGMLNAGADQDVRRVLEHAAARFAELGAGIRDVTFPSPDEAVRDATQLCAVEAAVAHEATFPSREADYGPVLAALLRLGHKLDALTLARIVERRAVFRGRVAALFGGIDLLLMPVMNWASPTLAWLATTQFDPDVRHERIRYTAPFDMTGNPTLTLPGGCTADGLPVGFQVIGRHLAEALVLRAGHAFQRVTEWHLRRPGIPR